MASKILIIVAGTNDPSNADVMADAMAKGMGDGEITKIRLRDLQIRHFELDCYGPNPPQDDMKKLQEQIEAAHGVVIATPVWNFSVPAHLKNLIDRMGAFGLDKETHSLGQFHGKPFFLLYTGGTPMSAWPLMRYTTSHMPVSIQYFGGSVLGKHFEPRCTLGRGVFGLVVDKRPESLKAIGRKGERFARIVKRYAVSGKLPLKYVIMRRFVRFGQTVKKKMGI